MFTQRIDRRDAEPPSSKTVSWNDDLSIAAGSVLPAIFARHGDPRAIARRGVLHQAGAPLTHVWLVTSGWFGRLRFAGDGADAFTGIHIPGDVIGLDAVARERLPDEVRALTDASVLRLPVDALRSTIAADGAAALEVVRLLADDAAYLREAVFSIGTQSGIERLSTFFLQTYYRLQAAGLSAADAERFPLPLTQVQLGAVTGLTSIHVNRVLKQLREARLLAFRGGTVHILDPAGLQRVAQPDG